VIVTVEQPDFHLTVGAAIGGRRSPGNAGEVSAEVEA